MGQQVHTFEVVSFLSISYSKTAANTSKLGSITGKSLFFFGFFFFLRLTHLLHFKFSDWQTRCIFRSSVGISGDLECDETLFLQEFAELWVDGEHSRYRQSHKFGSVGLELQQSQWHYPQCICVSCQSHILVRHLNSPFSTMNALTLASRMRRSRSGDQLVKCLLMQTACVTLE